MRNRKVPLRKCVACQEMKPKKEMIRVVKTPEDEVLIDVTGKKSGRGAYLCGNVQCLERAEKNSALDRALKIKISSEIVERLRAKFIFAQDDRHESE